MLSHALELVLAAAIAAGHGNWFQGLIANFFDPDWNSAHRTAIWGSIFAILILAGIGLPLPEDVPLTLSGFTTFKQANNHFHFVNYLATFAWVVGPILCGDAITYAIGRRWGFALPARVYLIGRLLPEKRMARVQRWFDQYGNFTVFLGRQVAGVRFVTFFSAGAMRMPFGKFVLFDFLGCLVSVPIWLTLGALAAIHGKEWLDKASRTVGHTFLLSAVGLFFAFYIFAKIRGGMKAKRENAKLTAHPPASSAIATSPNETIRTDSPS